MLQPIAEHTSYGNYSPFFKDWHGAGASHYGKGIYLWSVDEASRPCRCKRKKHAPLPPRTIYCRNDEALPLVFLVTRHETHDATANGEITGLDQTRRKALLADTG